MDYFMLALWKCLSQNIPLFHAVLEIKANMLGVVKTDAINNFKN